MTLVLRNSNLAPVVHSISSRVLLSMLHALPQMLPTSLSPDPTLHGRLLGEVQAISAELGSGTTSAMSKSLGLVIGAVLAEESNDVSASSFHGLPC
jgi:pre-rRNA-processing protein RIX1